MAMTKNAGSRRCADMDALDYSVCTDGDAYMSLGLLDSWLNKGLIFKPGPVNCWLLIIGPEMLGCFSLCDRKLFISLVLQKQLICV